MESLFLQKIKACQEDNKHFKVQTLEWVEQNSPFQNEKPYRIPFFEIIWIKDGSGYLIIDLKKYKIRAGTIYCIAPGIRQLQSNGDLKGYFVSLSADLLHLLESRVNFSLHQYSTEVVRICRSLKRIMKPNMNWKDFFLE